jgi:hypothetical protein
MTDVTDMELLQDYDRLGSEDTFAELVKRHVNLVYSAALRHVGIAAYAEEITQAVFIILTRKATSLRPDTVLEGWLYETTRLIALRFLRGDGHGFLALLAVLDEHLDRFSFHQLFSVELGQFVICQLVPRPIKIIVAQAGQPASEHNVVCPAHTDWSINHVFNASLRTPVERMFIE